MGYRLTILPGMLVVAVANLCELLLNELKRSDRHPQPSDTSTLKDFFRRVGADEWDAIRKEFAAAD